MFILCSTKWYKITRVGRQKLAEYRDDIEKRKASLDYFLNVYSKLIIEEMMR